MQTTKLGNLDLHNIFQKYVLHSKSILALNISLDGVINQEIHNRKVQIRSSKYPPTFDIDVIIDDSEGVKIEGKKHNFNAIVVHPNNINWVEDLKMQLLKIHSLLKQ